MLSPRSGRTVRVESQVQVDSAAKMHLAPKPDLVEHAVSTATVDQVVGVVAVVMAVMVERVGRRVAGRLI